MEENKTTIVEKTVKTGITFGSALAMVISLYNMEICLVGNFSWLA